MTIRIKDETKRDRRVGLHEEQALLAACSQMNGGEHKHVGPLLHDRLIGALETCCRKGEICGFRTGTSTGSIIRSLSQGDNAKDSENRRVPFDPQGRLAPILKRRASLGPSAFVFGSPGGEDSPSRSG